jgi:SAM-dependent methyltransferase
MVKKLLAVYWALFAFKRTHIKNKNRIMRQLDPYSFFMHENIILLASKGGNGKKILDVGSGGQWARNFFESQNFVYEGCDVQSSNNSDIQDFLVTNEILPVESDSYDIIIANSVLEHLKNPELAISEWFRALKPGGKLFLQTNFLFQEHSSPDDYFRFSIYGLHELLNRQNFEIKMSCKIGARFTFAQQLLLNWWLSKIEIPLVKFFSLDRLGKIVFLPVLFLTWLTNLFLGPCIFLILLAQSGLGNLPYFKRKPIFYTGVGAFAHKPAK